MGQKRTERKSTERGESGEAHLVKLDKNRARMDFVSTGKSYAIEVVQGNIWEDDKATLPEHVPFKAMKDNGKVQVRATLSADGKKVMYINPWVGEQKVKFVNFAAAEGQAPVWTDRPANPNKKGSKPYRDANPYIEIVEGRWKGCKLRCVIYDNFGSDPEDGNFTILGSGTGSDNLSDFMACLGVGYWNMPFTDNILPEAEKIGKENGYEFTVVMGNGWVNTFVLGGDDAAFMEEEEAPATEPDEIADDTNELLKD